MSLTQCAPLAPLTAYRQFINFKLVPRNDGTGKVDKLPVNPQGVMISAHDPAHHVSLLEAEAQAAACPAVDGVGFVFTAADPFFFFDIDEAFDPVTQQWSQTAQTACQQFAGACVEISQSGRGLHIFGTYSTLPPHKSQNQVMHLELYTTLRFVALTGTGAVGTAAFDCTPQLHTLVAQHFHKDPSEAPAEAWTTEPCAEYTGPEDDAELIRRMLGAKTSAAAAFGGRATFRDLWECDEDALAAAFPDPRRTFDASDADAALCQHLAFWTGKDCGRIDRLMRESGLMRDKWDRSDGYGAKTILRAVGLQEGVYDKPRPVPPVGVSAPSAGAVALVGTLRAGYPYLPPFEQVDYFRGCVYVRDVHKVFVPDGALLKPDQFKATYAGWVFALDSDNTKKTNNAWEAFVESQAVVQAKVEGLCFRPELPPCAVIEEEGRRVVNTYVPVPTARTAGDPSRFLELMARLLPDEGDRAKLLAYMAACVQHIGVKFQWAPVLQGVQGNGKTMLITALSRAVGDRLTHLPNAKELGDGGGKFNKWLQGKVFVGIEEIYVADKKEIIESLKPFITNRRMEIQGKGADQVTGDNRANFLLCSNHKDAILKQKDDRRYAMFFTAQQKPEDLIRDGMGGRYFPDLYAWFDTGGSAIITNYLYEYPIPDELNPATLSHRAPETSSTKEAISIGLGPLEQQVLEWIAEGRPGFIGGWISSMRLTQALQEARQGRRMSAQGQRDLLAGLDYITHPALNGGRVNTVVPLEGGKPRLYVKRGSLLTQLTDPQKIMVAYVNSQMQVDVAGGPVGATVAR